MTSYNNWGRPSGDDKKNFDWAQFERLMDALLPNVVPGMKGDPISRIGNFMRNVINAEKPGQGQSDSKGEAGSDSALFRTEVTETERYVKVRIRIPVYVDPRKLQLFINGQMLKIEGPLGNKQTVILPAPVGVKSGQAVFREESLHIRLRKRNGPGYKEVYIRYP